MVRYLFYTIGDLTYQSPLVQEPGWVAGHFVETHIAMSIP